MRSKGRTCRRSLPGALAVLLCLGAAPANAAEHASASSTTRFLASFSGPTRKASKSFSSPVELLSYVVPAAHAQVESQQTPQVRSLASALCAAGDAARG